MDPLVVLAYGAEQALPSLELELNHFFLMTAMRRNSFITTKRVFWAQNITHVFAAVALSWTPLASLQDSSRPLSCWGGEREGKGKGNRRGRWREENRSILVFHFPHFQPCTRQLAS